MPLQAKQSIRTYLFLLSLDLLNHQAHLIKYIKISISGDAGLLRQDFQFAMETIFEIPRQSQYEVMSQN